MCSLSVLPESAYLELKLVSLEWGRESRIRSPPEVWYSTGVGWGVLDLEEQKEKGRAIDSFLLS